QPSLAYFVGLLAFIGLGYLAIRRIQQFWDGRHPAVSEHRGELVELATKRMGCGPDALQIVAEEPTRARVDGCGHTATFRWGRVRAQGGPAHWREVDAACRPSKDSFGCNIPCD